MKEKEKENERGRRRGGGRGREGKGEGEGDEGGEGEGEGEGEGFNPLHTRVVAPLSRYVDHDYPLTGAALAAERSSWLTAPDFKRSIDNSSAFWRHPTPNDNPMNREMRRRALQAKL